MPEERATEAVVSLDAAGRYVDANPTALELLGVSLEEFLASPPNRFAVEPTSDAERVALRAEWEAGGGRPVVGTAGLKRGDGTTIRISYAVETAGDGLRARLWQIEGSPVAPLSVFTVGDVLREWRAAERDLAELVPGTAEWARRLSEIELLRAKYQELFQALKPRAGPG